MSTQQRMKDTSAGHKPRVYKLTANGMWWADVRTHEDKYVCDCFFLHQDALEQAYEYAAMNQAARALKTLEAAS